MGDAAVVLEQGAVEAKVRAQHLGDAEGEMPVRDREQDGFGEQRAEELDLLLVAGGTEPASLAGEGQQVFVLAVIAADAGKPVLKVAAVEELVYDLRYDGAQESIARLVALLVSVLKSAEMLRQALPKRRCFRFPSTVDLIPHARECIEGGVSSNGTPPKKVEKR